MGGAGVGEEVIHLTVSGFITEVFFFSFAPTGRTSSFSDSVPISASENVMQRVE